MPGAWGTVCSQDKHSALKRPIISKYYEYKLLLVGFLKMHTLLSQLFSPIPPAMNPKEMTKSENEIVSDPEWERLRD